MRVIAGIYKGRKLYTAKGDWLRPTSDRNREFLFAYLGNLIEEARVVDLFAGTGSLGIEALSRGASSATFVDAAFAAIQVLRKNLQFVEQPTLVCRQDAQVFLHQSVPPAEFIFADPPYEFTDFAALMELIRARRLLAPNGWLVYESGTRSQPVSAPAFTIVKEKKLGDTLITIYRLNHEE
jgi:16S rRNA (guanine966-N2)-methyltransferase